MVALKRSRRDLSIDASLSGYTLRPLFARGGDVLSCVLYDTYQLHTRYANLGSRIGVSERKACVDSSHAEANSHERQHVRNQTPSETRTSKPKRPPETRQERAIKCPPRQERAFKGVLGWQKHERSRALQKQQRATNSSPEAKKGTSEEERGALPAGLLPFRWHCRCRSRRRPEAPPPHARCSAATNRASRGRRQRPHDDNNRVRKQQEQEPYQDNSETTTTKGNNNDQAQQQ